MRLSVQKKVLKRMISRIYEERGEKPPFPDKDTTMNPGEMGEFYVHLHVCKGRFKKVEV